MRCLARFLGNTFSGGILDIDEQSDVVCPKKTKNISTASLQKMQHSTKELHIYRKKIQTISTIPFFFSKQQSALDAMCSQAVSLVED